MMLINLSPLDLINLGILSISLYSDCRYRRIYNWVVLPAMLLGLLVHTGQNGLIGLRNSGEGLLLGLGLLLIPFLLGGMGAGDVKLLGAIGALKGPYFIWTAFLGTALVGGLLSLVVLIRARKLFSTLKIFLYGVFWAGAKRNMLNLQSTPDHTESTPLTIPYGIAIVTGTLAAYCFTWISGVK